MINHKSSNHAGKPEANQEKFAPAADFDPKSKERIERSGLSPEELKDIYQQCFTAAQAVSRGAEAAQINQPSKQATQTQQRNPNTDKDST